MSLPDPASTIDAAALTAVRTWLLGFQDQVAIALSQREPDAHFREQLWDQEQGAGGRSRLLEGGAVFERAGVNFSAVHGDSLPPAASTRHPHLAGSAFDALGVSVVVHPRNPHVPTSHCNLRLFCVTSRDLPATAVLPWWFGGGFDLTPYYGYDDDVFDWHRSAHTACAPFGDNVYWRYKRWCDRYFYLPHRMEPRGIGGLFFDDLNEWGFNRCFDFIRAVGDAYLAAYLPIVDRRCDQPYGQRQRAFQCYRRGRYVEFNLIHDRGTLFGLQSGGRTESILMSLPPVVHWRYDWQPDPNSDEAALYERFLRPHNFDF